MNCNVSAYDSVQDTGLYKTLTNNADGYVSGDVATDNEGKITVKYIPVVEDDVIFYIQINSTFKTE